MDKKYAISNIADALYRLNVHLTDVGLKPLAGIVLEDSYEIACLDHLCMDTNTMLKEHFIDGHRAIGGVPVFTKRDVKT